MHLHERLGITFQELGAMLGFREMLKLGLVEKSEFDGPQPHVHRFNMSVPFKQFHCGTIGCIGGNMGWIMGLPSPYNYVLSLKYGNALEKTQPMPSKALRPLFYPSSTMSWEWIGEKEAINAIDNFLHDGNPRWEDLRYDRPTPATLDAITKSPPTRKVAKRKVAKRKVAVRRKK